MSDLTRTNDYRWATWGDASDAEIDEYRRGGTDGPATHHGPWCDEDPPEEACDACRPRQARCQDCRRLVPSDPPPTLFSHRPDDDFDRWYCGCRGWD